MRQSRCLRTSDPFSYDSSYTASFLCLPADKQRQVEEVEEATAESAADHRTKEVKVVVTQRHPVAVLHAGEQLKAQRSGRVERVYLVAGLPRDEGNYGDEAIVPESRLNKTSVVVHDDQHEERVEESTEYLAQKYA